MKNLYARLGIEPDADESTITERLDAHPEREAIGTVLLNAERRARYDRTHATVKMIAAMRHSLGLDRDETSWFLERYEEFAVGYRSKAPATRNDNPTEPAATVEPAAPAKRPARTAKPSRRPVWLVAGLVLAIGLAAAAVLAYRHFQ